VEDDAAAAAVVAPVAVAAISTAAVVPVAAVPEVAVVEAEAEEDGAVPEREEGGGGTWQFLSLKKNRLLYHCPSRSDDMPQV